MMVCLTSINNAYDDAHFIVLNIGKQYENG